MNQFKLFIHIFFVSLICLTSISYAEDVNENDLKGILLLKLPLFIDWPLKSFNYDKNSFSIGVFGNDDHIVKTLRTFEGRDLKGKKIIIQHFNKINDIKFCHILYICPTNLENLNQIIKKFKGMPVLLVGHQDGFAEKGGVINFYKHQDKFKFEINLDNGNLADLKISSKLLKLSRIVNNY
ncbi:conserved hypothetical protein, secreted [Candidatus Magnetomorum sp. HK-1]|nr:conserved hypothetical protein, secreted [Candidatus Magnetomorum sp. HK-1]